MGVPVVPTYLKVQCDVIDGEERLDTIVTSHGNLVCLYNTLLFINPLLTVKDISYFHISLLIQVQNIHLLD